METHLRPDFGPLSGAMKEKPITEIEDVKFNPCVFSGGIFDRVAEAGNEPNTWNLAFKPKISGTVQVRTNSRLVFGETITVEDGKATNVFLRGKFVLTRRMPVVSMLWACVVCCLLTILDSLETVWLYPSHWYVAKSNLLPRTLDCRYWLQSLCFVSTESIFMALWALKDAS